MSRKSAYEEGLTRKVDELPLPDEDASWQKMMELLDKGKKHPLPFLFWKDFRVLGMLTILLIGGGIWLMNKQLNEQRTLNVNNGDKRSVTTLNTPAITAETTRRKQKAGFQNTETPLSFKHAGAGLEKKTRITDNIKRNDRSDISKIKTSLVKQGAGSQSGIETSANTTERTTTQKKKAIGYVNNNVLKIMSEKKRLLDLHEIKNNYNNAHTKQSEKNSPEVLNKDDLATSNNKDGNRAENTAAINRSKVDTSSVLSISQNNSADFSKSSMIKSAIDSISRSKDSTANQKQIIKLTKPSRTKYLITAGAGIQQQIQTGGQQSIKYGYNAGSLVSDYIPSVWINLEKKETWFIQTGFVFSSPQLVREFAFNRQTTIDSFGATTNTLKLQKTFYSQVPVSFNYYVKPKWSVGAGMTFSWLRGAIAVKETSFKQNSSQTQLVSKEIVPIKGFTDSFLYRSKSFFTLQTDYHWKRVSLGLRYSRDLQSYIKYTMPDGSISENRNWGLQAVLRLRLWKRDLN